MQRVAISTLGCKINQFESAAMTESLGREGFRMVPFDEDADIYVINTCTVTAKTDAESRRLIRRALRRNPAARVVVTGCYAQVAPDAVKDLPGVSLVVGNSEKRSIVEFLRAAAPAEKVVVSDISRERAAEGLRLESFAEHTRAFLQVQNGCDAFCSYCIVPYARGRSRSVPFGEVLAGIRSFAAQGFREVVLTGIHLGAYGLDLEPPASLLELLEAAEAEKAVPRLRVGSVEPNELTDDLIDFLARSETVCPHLHIPLQSGDDRVLERMGRRYTAAFFRERVKRLVAAVPDIFIGCDVIAGFPGETDEEFQNTVRLIDELPVASLHVFPYSRREGTAAARMGGQVDGKVLRVRAEILREVGERKRRSFCERFVGRELAVLMQNRGRDGEAVGLSRNYLPVRVLGYAGEMNAEATVMVTEVTPEGVGGIIRG
ncbi:tRNA (N(6)-L-threonylcarbamoyladenosine(37)-C(2))-methylthiotransferase MtaB [Geobacter hydrogenophilus]|uniref:Threonylcarbamoyladenosine tRNA methylthiotransferase MtaB n=1 Tax=Geobacter hydrogenophilus TaxID=40983 RepID=A0A9W6FY32_9BACT|nr:tRNA (N(6)-L-threonylcarbamoyladenosine(37)-C(2))-methylthiotransferase MtaB [Geobacter hydrogenophilus]MBT0894628.1 tRNA (N(6)-L-threonylcarbamoyladenosine(37)-C(2))-methylthiotransferase MtaB [Geobacter hydrogenophilus]GLI37175.1 tRNA (N(6)-L-threonylcarbamoyladenosine(37)-C(2))-methylthiotransferase MtaB [Geobacter hydrogenophilus]